MNDLSASLNRLLEAVREASEALQRLSDTLESARTGIRQGPSPAASPEVRAGSWVRRRYVASGSPFGPSDKAARVWSRFGQRTTIN